MTDRRVLRTPDAADYTGLSISYLEKMRARGIGPKFVRMGRAVGYRLDDLDRWLDAQDPRTNESDREGS